MRHTLDDLLAIMARLRDPERGCPWDAAQTHESLTRYLLEETYEVIEAIETGDLALLREELGDLLLQVVFHAQMASERGLFDFTDVAHAIADKMRRRHPHVFADEHYADVEAQTQAWEAIKAAERAGRGEAHDASALAGVSRGLPEWKRAAKLQQRAAAVGFEWREAAPMLDKLAEEVGEVRAEFERGADTERLEDELGDVLFVTANLARHAGVDFSRALRRANAKFERRFRAMDALAAADGRPLAERNLEQQEALWQQAKRDES
jgi:ATP diphosphatase